MADYAEFLNEAARYFESRDKGGEDRAHWANVYNAENCRKAAAAITAAEARATAAEAQVARIEAESEYLRTLLDEAATKLENCRYSEQPMAEKIRSTLRALTQEPHDAK